MRFPQFSVVVCWQKAEETPARHFPNIGTIDLRIDYLRPGRGQHSVATGRVGRLGGRVAVAHMELVNDTDEQIAAGSACLHRRLTTGFEGFAQQSWPEMGPLPKLFEDIDLPLWSEIFCGVVLHVGGDCEDELPRLELQVGGTKPPNIRGLKCRLGQSY